MLFFLYYLQITKECVSLQCVFHSIRFKVNKGWSKALLLFLCPNLSYALCIHIDNIFFFKTMILMNDTSKNSNMPIVNVGQSDPEGICGKSEFSVSR